MIVVCQKGLHLLFQELTISTNTVRLHRVLRATPEQVYRAFEVPRTGPPRTHQLHQPFRQPAPAGGNADLDLPGAGVVRHRVERRPRRHPRHHSAAALLSGLAAVVGDAGAAGGSGSYCSWSPAEGEIGIFT